MPFVKVWTDMLNDPWFLSLTCNQRGVWLQLIILAKRNGDTGGFFVRNYSLLAQQVGCDRTNLAKILKYFHETDHIKISEAEKCCLIEIPKYDYWQRLTEKEFQSQRGNTCVKAHKTKPNQTKPNQTKPNHSDTNQQDQIPYKEIIEHLNQLAGKTFNYKSEATRKLIRGRFSEGFTKEDFFKVHFNKCNEWVGNSEMVKYLRPATLYAPSHFDDYLNQNTKPKEERHPDAPRY